MAAACSSIRGCSGMYSAMAMDPLTAADTEGPNSGQTPINVTMRISPSRAAEMCSHQKLSLRNA